MHSETALVLTVLVLCYAAVSGLVRRWYLAPAYTSLLVLLMLLHADPAQAHGRFNERVTASVVGVALAYLFGLLLPRLTDRRHGCRGSAPSSAAPPSAAPPSAAPP